LVVVDAKINLSTVSGTFGVQKNMLK